MNLTELPLHKTSQGILVPARSRESIWSLAEGFRRFFGYANTYRFPIMDVLELQLSRIRPDFHVQVVPRKDIDNDEARTIPGQATIIFAEDVYEGAINGNGRDLFTSAHELAHFILHSEVSLARPSHGFKRYRDSEWQANTFAGALLMSRRHFRNFKTASEMAEACGTTLQAAEVMFDKYKEEEEKKINNNKPTIAPTIVGL